MSVDSLVRTATADAQIWSYLLYISGGLLELPKCSVHIVFPKFYSSGKPYLCKPRDIPPIHLPDPRDLSPIEISCHPPDLEHKTLGHYKAPAGHLPKQRAALHRAADALTTMILRSFLFPAEARMVYFAIFLAKFSYVLPQCYFIPSVLRKIESKAQQAFTAKMGFSRRMSCAICYGPSSLGGLGLVRLETIQGVGQILNFIKHWRSYSYIGSLLRCTLAWAQINAGGVSAPLLMIPSLRLVHFESKFIQSLRNYLAAIDATIEVDTPFVPPCQRENDVYLMDVATSSSDFSVSDLRRLNFCRLFLQAVTASDIVLPTRSGDTIDPLYRHGDANLHVSPSTTYCPTTQAKPSKGSWNVWRRFCVLLEQQLASSPLGDWIIAGTDLRRVWQCYFDHATKLLYRRHPERESLFYRLYPTTDLEHDVFVTSEEAMTWSPTRASVPVSFCDSPPASHEPMTRCVVVVGGIAHGCHGPLQTPIPSPISQPFHTYVQSLPLSERQLLSDLEILIPVADLLDVLQQTTSTDNAKCYGVSDGSESSGSMTFGWVIAAPDGTRMVSCAGPAFGSQASSYRAEGYGFVSMALFLFHLRHFSSAIPDWRLTFVSDNLGLVTKTSQSWDYDFPFPNLTLASDYDVIHKTVMSLRQARVQASFSHVKGHQDTSKKPFASLPLTAQLNIEADELAGSYRRRHENAVHSRAPLLSHTRCLLHLDNTGSITRSYTTCLRTHAATPALHLYMMKRFHWNWDVLQSIDWPLFAWCQSKLQHAHRQVIKFGFDILPMYVVEARRNPAATSICPLCSSHPESNDHLYQCQSDSVRSWRSSTLADIRAVLEKWDAKYGLVEVLMAGLHCAFDPSEDSTLDPSAFPTSLHPLIDSQNSIGWRHLFRGRASSQWATFQQAEYQLRNPPPPPAISGSGMMTEVLVSLMSQILELWRQRNEFVFSATSNASSPLRRDRILHELRFIHSRRHQYRAGDTQFLLTADPDEEEQQFQHLLDTSGESQVEGWVNRWTPFFRDSLQKAKLLPTAVQLTPSIRTIFLPLRRRIVNIRGRPPDPRLRPLRSRRRPRPKLTGLQQIASFFRKPPPSSSP